MVVERQSDLVLPGGLVGDTGDFKGGRIAVVRCQRRNFFVRDQQAAAGQRQPAMPVESLAGFLAQILRPALHHEISRGRVGERAGDEINAQRRSIAG